MCECRYVHLCPSGHLPFRAPGSKNQKFSPPHTLPKNQKIFTALDTPSHLFPTLPTPSYAVHPPGRNGSGRPPRGSGGSWLRHNGSEGRDGGSRGLTGRVGRCGGVSRVWEGGDEGVPHVTGEGLDSVPVIPPAGVGRVWRGVPHVTGSGLDSVSVIPPPRPCPDPPAELVGYLLGTCRVLGGRKM